MSYLAYPSVDVAWFLNLSSDESSNPTAPYLRELQVALTNYDQWMWMKRNDSTCCALHGVAGEKQMRNCVLKTRNCVLNTMNFAGANPTGAWILNATCCPPTSSPGSGTSLLRHLVWFVSRYTHNIHTTYHDVHTNIVRCKMSN